jgi:hypothetical protein
MTQAQISILRAVLKMGGTYLLTRGFIKDETAIEPIIGGILAIVGLVWGYKSGQTAMPDNPDPVALKTASMANPVPLSSTKSLLLLFGMALSIVVAGIGCNNLSNNVFRTEQTATDMAYGGYTAWTNYLSNHIVSPQASNTVRQARLEFAASVGTLETMRQAYNTNSALAAPLQATLVTLTSQSSNLVWLINYFQASR